MTEPVITSGVIITFLGVVGLVIKTYFDYKAKKKSPDLKKELEKLKEDVTLIKPNNPNSVPGRAQICIDNKNDIKEVKRICNDNSNRLGKLDTEVEFLREDIKEVKEDVKGLRRPGK